MGVGKQDIAACLQIMRSSVAAPATGGAHIFATITLPYLPPAPSPSLTMMLMSTALIDSEGVQPMAPGQEQVLNRMLRQMPPSSFTLGW